MPYQKLEDLCSDNIIVYKAEGKITKEDYTKNLIPEVQKILDNNQKVRLVFDMTAMHLLDMSWTAMWEDKKFGIKKMNAFEKVALVTNHEKLIGMFKPFFHGVEMETFHEQQPAVNWIRE